MLYKASCPETVALINKVVNEIASPELFVSLPWSSLFLFRYLGVRLQILHSLRKLWQIGIHSNKVKHGHHTVLYLYSQGYCENVCGRKKSLYHKQSERYQGSDWNFTSTRWKTFSESYERCRETETVKISPWNIKRLYRFFFFFSFSSGSWDWLWIINWVCWFCYSVCFFSFVLPGV